MTTAPRDGSYIIAKVGDAGEQREHWAGRPFAVRFDKPGGGWAVFPGFGGAPDEWFTEWTPVPPSPAKQAPEAPPFTAERSSPHEQNTPSTPPDTPEGVSEAEAAMKEIFAKHGPALREALRPFQTLPAIGDEVVEAIRQMILVEEAEQTRLRSMPSAYSWNKVAVVDGKLDVLRKLSALHQAGKLPATGGER